MGRCNSDGSDLHELIGMAPVRDEARAEPRDDARDVRKSDSESGDDERSSLWITEPLFEVREVREADDSLAFQPELARQISERASELASELLAQASASFYVARRGAGSGDRGRDARGGGGARPSGVRSRNRGWRRRRPRRRRRAGPVALRFDARPSCATRERAAVHA